MTACYYRVLGQASLPFPIAEITEFIEAEVKGLGRFGGRIHWRQQRPALWWYDWEGINMSAPGAVNPIKFDMHIWGRPAGRNSVFTRVGFWRAYLVRSTIERSLGLKPGTLRTRFDIGGTPTL